MEKNIEGFLDWLKENDIGIGLCHLHTDDEYELTRDEWITLINEYLADRIEGFDGT